MPSRLSKAATGSGSKRARARALLSLDLGRKQRYLRCVPESVGLTLRPARFRIMKRVAWLLVLLLQCVSIVETSGLSLCTHADGSKLLETAGSRCCHRCVSSEGAFDISLFAGDRCRDRDLSIGSVLFGSSEARFTWLRTHSQGLDGDLQTGRQELSMAFDTVWLAPQYGPPDAGYAVTCARTDAPRC